MHYSCRYINIAKTIRRQPPPMGTNISGPSGGVGNIGKTQPASLPSTQPLRSPMGGHRGGPPNRQQSEELTTGSPYSSLEESTGYGSFPVVYQPDPRTGGTTLIMPSNVSSMLSMGGGGGAAGGYHHGPSSLDGYTTYPGYDHTKAKGGGRVSLDSYAKGTIAITMSCMESLYCACIMPILLVVRSTFNTIY